MRAPGALPAAWLVWTNSERGSPGLTIAMRDLRKRLRLAPRRAARRRFRQSAAAAEAPTSVGEGARRWGMPAHSTTRGAANAAPLAGLATEWTLRRRLRREFLQSSGPFAWACGSAWPLGSLPGEGGERRDQDRRDDHRAQQDPERHREALLPCRLIRLQHQRAERARQDEPGGGDGGRHVPDGLGHGNSGGVAGQHLLP